MATIYHTIMHTIKTTVYLDAAEYQRLKVLAERAGRSAAEMVREAVSEYARKATEGRPHPSSVGAGRSGGKNLSERSEEILKGMTHPR
jgi:hypothetical protein